MLYSVLAAALATAQPIAVGPLHGTVEKPTKPPRAAALIIPGSGPTDRDGNSPLGVNARPYALLAEALAARDIATVRIDKRGVFESQGGGDPNAVTLTLYADDVASWSEEIRKVTGQSCVWLIGHSEGALVALESPRRTSVCGLVLLAAPGRPMGDILREQLRANPANAPLLADAERVIGALETGSTVDVSQLHPALAHGLFAPSVQDFLIDLMRHDPAKMLAEYSGDTLIIHGGRDLQIGAADHAALAGARKGVQEMTLPAMNHVLKLAPEDRAGNLATYRDASLPLAPGLADAIASFILRQSSR